MRALANRLARTAAFACVTLASIMAAAAPASPQGMSLIRDAEIEDTIHAYAAPLLEAANLGEGAVKLHIVNDPNINAFVAGGPNLFLSSGMLAAAEAPGEIVGVLAHEIGHIAGGHLVRTRDALENASAEMILATVLAAGAIIAGEGEVGSAVLSGGQAMAQQSFLRYSRAQEESADQAAIRLLERTGQSAEGLLRMFERLEERERLSLGEVNSYARTHPLTRERIRFVRDHVARTGGAGDATPEAVRAAHRRMVAKLKGFLDEPKETFRAYPAEDDSLEARYARAIAHYRIPDLDRSLAELDGLLAEYPDDPWFHELKGQVLFENGRVEAAIAPYSRAVALKEDAALLRLGLARAQIETGDAALIAQAVENLEAASRLEPKEPQHWYQLGIARGRAGERAASSLAFAEAAYLRGDADKAQYHATVAAEGLPHGSARWLRAEDIRNAAEQALKRRR